MKQVTAQLGEVDEGGSAEWEAVKEWVESDGRVVGGRCKNAAVGAQVGGQAGG